MEEANLTPRDYVAIARRRKWHFVITTAVLFVLAIIITIIWPSTYRSEATVLVEQADVPEDLVNTLITDYVEARLEAINRRVMVTDNLLRIIERYNLYPEKREVMSITDVIDDMRDDIHMDLVGTDVTDPHSGRTSTATVAFTVGFDHHDPEMAQKIANEIVSLYLNENLKQRRERATESATFLRQERERVEQQIEEISRQFSDYKAANNGALPEQLLFNQQQLARDEQELRDIGHEIQSFQERESYLKAQLALSEPYQTFGSTRNTMSPRAQLDSSRIELATMRARYGPDHPDVVRAARDVKSLEDMMGMAPGLASLERQRDVASQNLQDVQTRYKDDHPDVQRAKRELQNADAAIAGARHNPSNGNPDDQPDNPIYISLQTDLSAVQTQLPALIEQRQKVIQEIDEVQTLVMKTPMVEREYDQLESRLEEATKLREDLAQKELAAQLGQNLEVELKGERFSLIEPPLLPTDPKKPRRILLVILGFVLSVGGGFGMVVMTQVLDDAPYHWRRCRRPRRGAAGRCPADRHVARPMARLGVPHRGHTARRRHYRRVTLVDRFGDHPAGCALVQYPARRHGENPPSLPVQW